MDRRTKDYPMMVLLLFATLFSLVAAGPVETTTTASSSSDTSTCLDNNLDPPIAIGLAIDTLSLPPRPSGELPDDTTYTIAVMTCHGPHQAQKKDHWWEHERSEADNKMALQCCSSLIVAANDAKFEQHPNPWTRHLLDEITTAATTVDNAKDNDIVQRCLQEGSLVPYSHARKGASSFSLQYTFYAASVSHYAHLQYYEDSTYSKDDPTSSLYMWAKQPLTQEGADDAVRRPQGIWYDKIRTLPSVPTWIAPFLPTHNNKFQAMVNFTSQLSQRGGMHRSFRHQMELDLDGDDGFFNFVNQESRSSSEVPISLNASFLLMLPKDLFMDQEDAFDTQSWNVNLVVTTNADNDKDSTEVVVSLSTAKKEYKNPQYSLSIESHDLINIELPAFLCPHHAAIISVTWNSTSLMSSLLEQQQLAGEGGMRAKLALEFATKVHTRYPEPVSLSDGTATSLYRPILMVPPLWLSGTMSLESSSSLSLLGTAHPWNLFGYHDVTTTAATTTSTWVAAANADDFWWVATLSVFFAVSGAVYLFWEISKVAVYV